MGLIRFLDKKGFVAPFYPLTNFEGIARLTIILLFGFISSIYWQTRIINTVNRKIPCATSVPEKFSHHTNLLVLLKPGLFEEIYMSQETVVRTSNCTLIYPNIRV